MLKNEAGQKAMEGLIQDKIIKNFSIEDMKELVEKGESTDQADFQIFKKHMSVLYDQISWTIDSVEEKFHQKIEEMNPNNQLSNPEASQAKGPSLGNK